MERHDDYTYAIVVHPADALTDGRWGFVATVVDLCRAHADGTVQRFATPFGQYHGQDAADAAARARQAVARWVEAQRGL